MRGGDPFPGEAAMVWEIYGDKGEIRITKKFSTFDVIHESIDIQLHVFGSEVRRVELPKDNLSDLAHPGQNIGKIYEAYAMGNEGGEGGYPTWSVGLKLHQLMEEMMVNSGF